MSVNTRMRIGLFVSNAMMRVGVVSIVDNLPANIIEAMIFLLLTKS